MGDLVGYTVREGVALVTVDNPPVNALSHPVRIALDAAITKACGDAEVGAVVIQAEGRTFPAGADLREFSAQTESPTLGELCNKIEACPKPVLAAVHGTALGGGLELALACHYRLVHIDARLGLPDVALGIVPSAGASQRLPRITGARPALDMLLSARPISAEGAARIGLVEKVIKKNLDRAAFGSARNMIAQGVAPRPGRDRRDGFGDPNAYLAVVKAKRVELADDRRRAAHVAVELVEAALLLPFDAGLELERVSYEDLVESDQARSLRHLFLAERRTARGRGLAPDSARAIAHPGIVAGSGSLATEIVRTCLAAGMPVSMVIPDDAGAAAGARAWIAAALAREVARGRLTQTGCDARLGALTVTDDMGALAGCDLVIAAEDATDAEARARFAQLGAATTPGTVLASTATRGDLGALAEASGRPADVMGMHFFAPAHRLRLIELLHQPRAAADLAATGASFARAIGKVPVLPATPGQGFVVPVFAAFWQAAVSLLEDGTGIVDIDTALRGYGFARGPFQMLDRIGLDHLPGAEMGDGVIARMIAQGWTGIEAGRGFYAYGDDAAQDAPAPGVGPLIQEVRRAFAIEPRSATSEEIQARCVWAMTNAGARAVAASVAACPSDVDVAMALGFGFPRWRGGPMEAADLDGLLEVRARLRDWAEGRKGGLWDPAPLFDELIKTGRGFASLNR